MQENMQKMPNAISFMKTFRPYMLVGIIIYTFLISIVTFISICVSMPDWQISKRIISLFMDAGAISDGNMVRFGMFVIGLNHASIIAAGVNVAGVIASGTNAGGVVAIGINAVGPIAIGVNAFGIIAIGCSAFGVVAIGKYAFGIYSLSYSPKGRGKHLLAPHRQDPEAIDFFRRWLPKLSSSLSTQ